MHVPASLYSIAFLLNALENPFAFMALIAAGALFLGYFKKSYGLSFFIAIALTFASTHIIKSIFKIARPEDALASTVGYRFPSMHSAIAGAFITSIGWHLFFHTHSRPLKISIVVLGGSAIVFVAWTRLLLGVHEMIDVVVGASLGIGVSLLLHGLMRRYKIEL